MYLGLNNPLRQPDLIQKPMVLHHLRSVWAGLSPTGFLTIAVERIKFVLFYLVSLGWRGAKARGEAPGLEDPDIASLLSDKESENKL